MLYIYGVYLFVTGCSRSSILKQEKQGNRDKYSYYKYNSSNRRSSLNIKRTFIITLNFQFLFSLYINKQYNEKNSYSKKRRCSNE